VEIQNVAIDKSRDFCNFRRDCEKHSPEIEECSFVSVEYTLDQNHSQRDIWLVRARKRWKSSPHCRIRSGMWVSSRIGLGSLSFGVPTGLRHGHEKIMIKEIKTLIRRSSETVHFNQSQRLRTRDWNHCSRNEGCAMTVKTL
jgi:hypothetical protein